MWDKRYSNAEYAYGKDANTFLQEWSHLLSPNGRLLCLAEGEGRNAVYLAENRFDVTAIDSSKEGMKKALLLANEKDVSIKYSVSKLENFNYQLSHWDGIISIFAHTNKTSQKIIFNQIKNSLKVGGVFILEGYNIEQLVNKTGGPKVPDMMFDLAEIRNYFDDFEVILAQNQKRDIKEGLYHTGISDVVQFIGKRIF